MAGHGQDDLRWRKVGHRPSLADLADRRLGVGDDASRGLGPDSRGRVGSRLQRAANGAEEVVHIIETA